MDQDAVVSSIQFASNGTQRTGQKDGPDLDSRHVRGITARIGGFENPEDENL